MPNVFRTQNGQTIPAASFTAAVLTADGTVRSRHRDGAAALRSLESAARKGVDVAGWELVEAQDQDTLAQQDAREAAKARAEKTAFAMPTGTAWGQADTGALDNYTEVLDYIETGLESLAELNGAALEALVLTDQPAEVVGVLARVQGLRSSLKTLEDAITDKAAHAFQGRSGTLANGQAFSVKRSAARKAWDHDAWKHDVRAAVARELVPADDTVILDAETGETTPVRPLLIQAMDKVQQAQGSSAPKVTALKAYGLEADEYCETSAGSWTVSLGTTPTD